MFFKSLLQPVTFLGSRFRKHSHNRFRKHKIPGARARSDQGRFPGSERLTDGLGVEFSRCGCYLLGQANFRRKTMPKNPSPYWERVQGRSAICFHCRMTQRIDEDVFIDHWDLARTGDNPKGRGWYTSNGVALDHRYRRIGTGEHELCPGSGTAPIPIAYQFPDGSVMPRWRYYGRW